MEVTLLVFKKDDTKTIANYEVKRLMKVLSNSIEEDSFLFIHDGKEYRLNYLISKDGSKRRILKITIDLTEYQGAIVLDSIRNMLIQGEHRSKYFITVLYDDASNCFCKKGMPYIAVFERRLRELIYLILIKTYGIEWTDKTLTDEINKKLQRYNKSKLTESALELMDIGDLENYLFEPRRFIDPETWLEELFEKTDFDTIEKQELVKSLYTLRKTTLWDLFFIDIEPVQGIKEELDKIRDYRNKVMHNKTFMYSEYLDLKRRIKPLSKNLLEAIEVIEERAFTEPMGYVSATALISSLPQTIINASKVAQSLVDSMKPIAKRYSNLSESLVNSMIGFTVATEQARKTGEILAKSIGPILENLTLDSSSLTNEQDVVSNEEMSNSIDKANDESLSNEGKEEDNEKEPEDE